MVIRATFIKMVWLTGLILYFTTWASGQLPVPRQAVMYLKNGVALDVRVLSESRDTVGFYREDYYPGPVFRISSGRIDSLKFENGEVSRFENRHKSPTLEAYQRELQSVPVPDLIRDFDQHRTVAGRNIGIGVPLMIIGGQLVAVGTVAAMVYAFFPGEESAANTYLVAFPVAALVMGSGIALTVKGNRYRRRLKLIRQELKYRSIDPDHVVLER